MLTSRKFMEHGLHERDGRGSVVRARPTAPLVAPAAVTTAAPATAATTAAVQPKPLAEKLILAGMAAVAIPFGLLVLFGL